MLFFAVADEPAKFTIEGNVVNSVTGEPLRRAAVALQGANSTSNNATLNADAGGHFVLSGLPEGTYTISAEKQGFEHVPPISVEIGPSKSDLTIKLVPFGRIAGKVVDDAGDPILNANIQLFRAAIQNGRRQIQPAGTGMTDDLGDYHVSSLPAGRYYVSVTARPELDGAAYARTFFGGGSDLGAASPVKLAPGGSERADIRMQAVRSFAVRGTIVNLPENLHPYLNIARRGSVLAAAEAHATNIDSATGKFEFRGVTPGDWVVTAGCFERGTQLFGSAEVIVSDGDAGGLTVALRKAIELTGTIRSESSSAPPLNIHTVYLALRPAGDGSQAAAGVQIHDDGTFIVPGIQPGEYVLAARVGDPWYVKSAHMGGRDILNNVFTLTPAGVDESIEVVISSGGGEISGTVVDGTTPARSSFVLLLGPGQERTQRIDATGGFRFGALPPGDYRAYAFPDLRDLEYTNPDAMQRFSSGRINVTEGARQQVELKLNRTVY
jgi:hypothetical protein